MATNEQREVSTPLDSAVDDLGSDADADTDEGGPGGGDDSAPAPQAARSPQGQFQRQPGKAGRPARADRRQEFGDRKKMNDEITGLKSTIQQQQARYERDMAELRAMATRQHQPAPRQDGPAQGGGPTAAIDATIATLKTALQAEIAGFRGRDPNTPYDTTRYDQIREQLEDARQEKNFLEFFKKRGIDPDAKPNPAQRAPTRQDVAQTAADVMRRDTIYAENPWLVSPPQGMDRAQVMKAFTGTLNYLIEVKGRPVSVNTDREAAAIVMRDLRIPPPRTAARAPRAPLSDDHRGNGGDDGPASFDVPTAQLDGHGLSPEALRRVAARMARERR